MYGDKEIKQMALRVSIALSAGVFSIMPVAYGAPSGGEFVTGGGEKSVLKTEGKITDVVGTVQNNVINWQDFSVAQGETVRFDGGDHEKNYLNVVTGAAQSQINGAIQGGKDVYIINPHGVVFGENASVDVGALYVSTRSIDDTVKTNFATNGTIPFTDTSVTPGGDVVNMGSVQANSVFLEGGNIIIGDADKIAAKGAAVTIQTPGNIAINSSVSSLNKGLGYSFTNKTTVNSTGLIKTEADWQAIPDYGLDKSYALNNNLDFSDDYTPIGDAAKPFTGSLDGRYHTVAGITVASGTYGGLFGYTKNADIRNVGVVGGNIQANNAGGIAGYAVNTTFTNVFNEQTRVGDDVDNAYGGIVGYAVNSTINTAYNTGNIGSTDESGWGDIFNSGGIIGRSDGTTIKHVYNKGMVANGIAGSSSTGGNTVKDAYYTEGKQLYTSDYNTTTENVINNKITNTDLESYKGLLSSVTNVGSNDSANTTVWRIYEGQTTPLLRAFLLKGGSAVTVDYKYKHGAQTGANNGVDLTADSVTDDGSKLTYNGSYMAVTDTPSYTYSGVENIDTSKIHYGSDEATNGVKNAKTQALFYSEQQGYELIGGNVTMAKRKITVKDADIDVSKVYDGSEDATAAFTKAFSEGVGTGTSGGILAADKDYVKIDYSDGFKATFAATETKRGKDAGKDKTVNLTGSIDLKAKSATPTAKEKEILANYELADADKNLTGTTVKGTITQRTLFLTIKPTTGINKTYDGNAEVAAKYAADEVIKLDTTTTVAPENAQTSTVGLITGDKVALKGNDAQAYYVDADETHNSNAGDHKVLYTGVALDTDKYADAQNYVLKYQTGTGTGTKEVEVSGGKVLLDGTINRRLILSDDFKVEVGGVAKDATKTYDGDDSYTLPEGAVLVAPTGSSDDTGVIDDDKKYVHFALKNSGSYFTDNDGVRTANASDNTQAEHKAAKVAYAIDATADAVERDGKIVNLLANYQIGTVDDYKAGKAKNLDTATDITAGGNGTITRRAINITAENVTGIEKEYDGDNKLKETDNHYAEYTTMGNKVQYTTNSPTLVGNDKFIIGVEYDDKNVKRDAAGEVQYNEKNVYFKTYIDGDAGNYTLNGTKAETYKSTNELTLSGAKGTITPKIITPEFNKISKTYDGSEAIDANNSTYDWGTQLVGDDKVKLIYSTAKDKAYFTEADGTTKAQDVSKAAKVRYTDLNLDNGNYELSAKELTGAGEINRRLILSDSFTVNGGEAAKVYDGKSTFTLQAGVTLTSQAGASGNTGVVAEDVPHLHFTLNPAGKTYFTEADGTTEARDVAKAKKVAYAVDATTDTGYEHLLGNYKLGTQTSADNLDEQATNLHVSGKGHIDRRALTITAEGVENINKTYDKTDVVKNENGSDYFTMGKAVKYAAGSAEKVDDDGTDWNITAVYNGADGADVYRDPTTNIVVPNGKAVTFKVNLTGDAAANYTLNGKNAEDIKNDSQLALTGAKGTINPAVITPVFNKIIKTYTGTTLITDGGANSSQVTLQGNLDGNQVTLNYATDKDHAYFAGANAGDYTGQVTYTGFALAGDKKGNYQLLSDTTTGDGYINKAAIGMSDLRLTVENVSREYNGGTAVGDNAADFVKDAYIDFGDGQNNVKFTYTGITSAEYSSADPGKNIADAGSGKDVTYTITGIAIPAEVLANFDWKEGDGYENTHPYTITGIGTITPKKVYAVVKGPVTKDYDATAAVVPTGESLVHIEGLLADDVNNNETVAEYIDSSAGALDAADHGNNKAVKYTVKLNAASADNYIIYDDASYTTEASASFTTHNNVINQRDLTLTFNPVTKVYDGYANYGDSTFTGDKAYNFAGKQGNDAITIADGYTANASYNSANVKEANTVTYAKLTINGNAKGNYRLLDKDGKELKADVNGQYTTTGTGTIAKYVLDSAPTINFEHVNKEYDGTNAVVSSRIDAENDPKKFINATINTGSGAKSLGFDLEDAHYTGSYVNSDDGRGIRAGGEQNAAHFTIKFSSDNYDFNQAISDPNFKKLADGSYQYSATYDGATITPRTITVGLGEALNNKNQHYVTKTYNGDDKVQQAITQDLFTMGAGDVLTKTDGTKDKVELVVEAQYQGKNADAHKNVDYNLSLTGADANNYRLQKAQLTGEGDIQKAELVVNDNTFAPVEKDYDGNANVTTLTPDKVYLVGVQKADGTYETINVANAVWDGVGEQPSNKIIGTYDSPNVQWQDGTDEEAAQGVTYSNLQNALESMTDGEGKKISTNYTIAAEAKGKGKIKAIEITNDAVAHWTPVTREYNADYNVDGVVYSYKNKVKGDNLLKTQDILQLAVKDKDGQEIAVDYTATANFNGKDVGDTKTLNYEITKVDRKVADKDGNRNYKLSDNVYNKLLETPLTSNADNQISKRQINAVVQQKTDITKVYDGTANASVDNFVLDEADRQVLAADGYNVDEVIEKTAAYRDGRNANISPGEAKTNSRTIDYTLKMKTSDGNYEVSTPTATATGDIERCTLNVTATPVSVNTGEAMPAFTGTVTGFVNDEAKDNADFIKGFTFKAADGVTTNAPGSYGVYGWYKNADDTYSKDGLLGQNYIYHQAPSNATALTVNPVNTSGNPDTKITPNNNIYNQISKDMSSGFGDNGLAAIEYKDKQGNTLTMENIDSGFIHGTGQEIGVGAADESQRADKLANIGIVGGDIVNMDGVEAAGNANIAVTGNGSTVNLEVFSLHGDAEAANGNAANETGKPVTTDNNGVAQIEITDKQGNILRDDGEDKVEKQEKEGEIAIKSADSKSEDEIELKVEKNGVNVA